MPVHYIYLFFAVVAETIATASLQASQQFTKLGPSLIVVIGYAISFYLLSLTLKYMPVGVMYAIWSGLGVILIAGIGWQVFGQKLDLPALLGIALIIAGVIVINLFSDTARH
jgi:small multidrug resistance pump